MPSMRASLSSSLSNSRYCLQRPSAIRHRVVVNCCECGNGAVGNSVLGIAGSVGIDCCSAAMSDANIRVDYRSIHACWLTVSYTPGLSELPARARCGHLLCSLQALATRQHKTRRRHTGQAYILLVSHVQFSSVPTIYSWDRTPPLIPHSAVMSAVIKKVGHVAQPHGEREVLG